MQLEAWKKTCKKINGFLTGLVHLLFVSYKSSKTLVGRQCRRLYSSAVQSVFGSGEKRKRPPSGFQGALRSATLPLERSKHESAKKLLKHARKQYLDLSLAPYRMLHSSLHHGLKGYGMRNVTGISSYKKVHIQSERLHHKEGQAVSTENHEFVEYKAGKREEPIDYGQAKKDPRLWHNVLDVGSCLEI